MEITWIHILTPQPQTHTHTCVRARTHARTHTHSVISHIPSTEIGMNVYPHTKPLHHSAPRTCSYIQSVLTQPSVCTACTYVLYHRQHMRTMYYCTSMRTTYVLHIAYLGRLLSRSAVEPWSVSTLVTRVRGVSVSRLVTRVRGVSVTSDESVRCVCVYTSDESVRCVCQVHAHTCIRRYARTNVHCTYIVYVQGTLKGFSCIPKEVETSAKLMATAVNGRLPPIDMTNVHTRIHTE